MTHKGGVEALSKTLRDIRENCSLMGSVTVLLAGDFQQTLPVFAQTWLQIGDGNYPTVDSKIIILPSLGAVVKSLTELTNKVYPDINNIKVKPIDWICERAVLTLKNDRAASINDVLLKSFEGEEIQYKFVDSPAALPRHNVTLTVGPPVMLLRNLNSPKFCNGTRLQITAFHRNVVEATIITGCAQGENVFIPRLPLIPSEYPFEFKRLQFPLKVCFAMTINKAQGQTLTFFHRAVTGQRKTFNNGKSKEKWVQLGNV
ncbi:uncharacterized protein LOC135134004 [Zophobas morio]|uniref:uncharacterized protein LOC135134004 n=1 Tax=Zophobas morio TaxID=2755281 RepID=UPI0030836C9D